MFKTIVLLKRRKDVSIQAFIEYYESHHRKIGEKYLSGWATKYVRRYLSPVANPITGEIAEADYDVVTETWYPDRQRFEATLEALSVPEIIAEIAEDEERFLDRSKNRFFVVEEHESILMGS